MRRLNLVQYRHPTAGFSLPIPPNWERTEDPQPLVALAAMEPPSEVYFRANVVVTVDELPVDTDLDSWQATIEELFPQQLPNYLLIDQERIEADQGPMLRRLAHYAADNTGSVTMEQRATIRGARGYTLTASVATIAYDSLADLFADMAQQFDLGHPSDDAREPR